MIGYRALALAGLVASVGGATRTKPPVHQSTSPQIHQSTNPRSHVVRMQGGRFAPYELTIAKGDTVRFVLGSGGPHNVAFRETKGEAADRLRKRMPDQISDLSGPLLVALDDVYVIVFADVPTGLYPYWCIPHLGMGQMGSITVK